MTATLEAVEECTDGTQQIERALQEILYFNHLKRMYALDEQRLLNLMDDLLRSIPPSLGATKIGDIIDCAKGLKGFHGDEDLPFLISDFSRFVLHTVPDGAYSDEEGADEENEPGTDNEVGGDQKRLRIE